MDGYQLAVAIIELLLKFLGGLAWPAVFVLAIWLFREKLNALLPLLRMKYKDFDVSFRLEQAEREAAQIAPPAAAAPELQPTPEERSRFEQVAEHSPRAAILEKRAELEQAIRTAAEPYLAQSSPRHFKTMPLSSAIRVLRNHNIIDEKTSALLDDLRVIGNRAAHTAEGDEFTKDEAMRFGKLAENTLRYIQMLL